MDQDLSSDEEEPQPPKNAFSVLMAPPSKKQKADVIDPIVIAAVYIRMLVGVPELHPLYRIVYIGQAVRATFATAQLLCEQRWKEENLQALHEDKDIGLIHCLDAFGPDAFDDKLIDSLKGPRSEVQKWANELEIALIAEHGGVFRDPSTKCRQTLNLTKGGKWGCSFEAIDALRTVAWLKCKKELEDYFAVHGTAYVEAGYVSPSGYKLGQRLAVVRSSGGLLNGHPDEAPRRAWLESLFGWSWDNRHAPDAVEKARANGKAHAEREEASDPGCRSRRAKAQMERKEAADPGCHSRRAKAQFAREKAEDKKSLVDRFPEWWADLTNEQRAEHARKVSKAIAQGNAAKRSRVLAALTGDARETQEKKNAINDKNQANRSGKTNALMKLPEYADKSRRWCYDNYSKVTKAGVMYFQDEQGVCCARMAEQGDMHAAAQASRDAKRANVIAALTGDARKKKQAEYDSNDRNNANHRGKVNALMKLPEYADKSRSWCYANYSKVTKDGVVYFQDANDVWCARMAEQGGAGSSADHARTEPQAAKAAETAEEVAGEASEEVAPEEAPGEGISAMVEIEAGMVAAKAAANNERSTEW